MKFRIKKKNRLLISLFGSRALLFSTDFRVAPLHALLYLLPFFQAKGLDKFFF